MLNRAIRHTEQADLHLLYHNNTLFIKPLPAYLLCSTTWSLYLNDDIDRYKEATGFLLSYIWLIRSPLDFDLANEDGMHLLPPSLKWETWKAITDQFLDAVDVNSLDQVNKRYRFGELRLSRLNLIYRLDYRFLFTHFVRGYLYGSNPNLFQRNLNWLLVVCVLFSLILSAMQVGALVPELEGNKNFIRACYGFVVFSIVLMVCWLAFVAYSFLLIFLYNMFAAISRAATFERQRWKLVQKKREVTNA